MTIKKNRIAIINGAANSHVGLVKVLEESFTIEYLQDGDALKSCLVKRPPNQLIKAIIVPGKDAPYGKEIKNNCLVYALDELQDIVFVRGAVETLSEFDQITSFHELISFQNRNKYLLMMYHQLNQKKLGKLAASNPANMESTLDQYRRILIESLAMTPTPGQITNTLLHIFGYFKKTINDLQKKAFFSCLDEYYLGKQPLKALLGMLYGFSVETNIDYLVKQTIFQYYR